MEYLRATSDDEIGKIGSSPLDRDANQAIHSLLSSAVGPPQPSDSASSDPIFVRNAASRES
jgi:hypothetical protein